MGKGQSFLALKSWHPATLKNQERVWVAEQQQLQHQKEELQRAQQLRKEREHEDAKHLVREKNDEHGVSWMYAAPTTSAKAEDSASAQETQSVGKKRSNDQSASSAQHSHDRTVVAAPASDVKRYKRGSADNMPAAAPKAPVSVDTYHDPMTALWSRHKASMLDSGVVGGRDEQKSDLYQLVVEEDVDVSKRPGVSAHSRPSIKLETQSHYTKPLRKTDDDTRSRTALPTRSTSPTSAQQPSLDSMSEAEMLSLLKQLRHQRRKLSQRVTKQSRSPNDRAR